MIRRINLVNIILIVAIIAFLYMVKSALMPVVIALIVAYALNPLAEFLSKIVPRSVVAFALVLSFFAVIAAILITIAPAISHQYTNLAVNFPKYTAIFKEKLQYYQEFLLERIDPALMEQIKGRIDVGSLKIDEHLATSVRHFVVSVFTSTVSFINLLILFVLTPIISFYFIRDWSALKTKVKSLIPKNYRAKAEEKIGQIDAILSAYLRGQVNVCMFMMVYYSVLLTILKLDSALLIGVSAGIIYFIPFVGFLLGLIIGLFEAASSFQETWKILAVLAVFISGNLIESYLISPKFVGNKVGLHPVMMIISAMVGGSLWGILGIIISIPLTSILINVVGPEIRSRLIEV